jgi:NAD(P)-dependent dehydrogenase (short-subunit alcohol dehydrogenase family)
MNKRTCLVTDASRGIGRALAIALAAATVFLCLDAATFITGEVLNINGGVYI